MASHACSLGVNVRLSGWLLLPLISLRKMVVI